MTYKVLDSNLYNKLREHAQESERLRYHLNLHRFYDEPVQRVIISLMHGTYIPPHYHELNNQWECFNVISGDVCVLIFDRNGTVTEKIYLGQKTGVFGIELSPNTTHTLLCVSDDSMILEIKEGPFNPGKAKVKPHWSPDEQYHTYSRDSIVTTLEKINPGDNFPDELLKQASH